MTFQSLHPLRSTEETPCPIGYFEVKILNLECKEPSNFGVGLAQENFQMLKNVGSDTSIALRGNAKISYLSREERVSLASQCNIDFKKPCTTVGVGYIFRSRKVFFTINGREVFQMNLPDCMLSLKELYPTISLGSLKDKI